MTTDIIGIVIALIFSAFFSGVEIAFVSSNKVRFELDKKKKGITSNILNLFYRNHEMFISTMLVGNNIALVIYGILMASMLEPLIARVWQNEAFIVMSQTIISTLLILVTAEFIPKTVFKINPNFLLKVFALPLYLIYIILYPVTIFTTFISRLILGGFGFKVNKGGHHGVLTKVDLDFFIQQSIDESADVTLTDPEVIMFQNALDFSSLKARDCMVPRTELIAINIDSQLQELMGLFIETGFSKIPVYKGNIDNIVGYIHSSEMFKRPENWTTKITQIPIVPETMAVNKLMKQLLEKKRSIAVVVDEFGGTAGVITMEDLFEEIFGDFEDEHDTNNYIARKLSDDEFELSGRLEIEKINELFALDIPESDEYVTLAGFILHYYQTIPKLHDVIEIGDFEIKI
ncbi:MAG: hemolysin family protein, partial [Bacteroidales bacterium]